MEEYHRSVLLKEAVEALQVKKDSWFLDCTLGDGGHSLEILGQGGKVVGIDVDPQALERVKKRFKDEGIDESRFKLIQGNFRDIDNLIIKQADTAKIIFAGAIFDLGVSSLQLETPSRGFSFGKLGPLDMRMDPGLGILALDLVNNLSGKEIYEIFKKLGEEKYSKRLVNALVRARQVKPFTTTLELADLIARTVGRKGKIHPATKVFQALRIVVNDELNALKEGLVKVKEKIQKNGQIVIISFHSLEDRIVKNAFKEWESGGEGQVLTKKPVVPSDLEIINNPRSRSAKMRVFEKI